MGRTVDQYLLAAYDHHNRALQGYRCSLSNVDSETCHAIFGCACLLFITSFSRPSKNPFPLNQPNITTGIGTWLDFQLSEWTILIKGLPSIVYHSELLPILRQGPMSPLMTAGDNPHGEDNQDHERNFVAFSRLRDLSEAIGKQSNDRHIIDVCQSSISVLREVIEELPQNHDTVLAFTWPMKVNPDYLVLLENKAPETLLVFAYYCALLHLMSSRWFTKSWPRSILESIREIIEEKWAWLLKWPMETVLGGQMLS
ncbi:hypothetical protein N7466_001137 [Penicillium verhagenii]|uniref:uncharacterized protein n=1 Tax=Penicillium verhagenii TaxID=1562060 RepID=UPI002544D3F4|nr:uncharacterized protein N7466_001137 [Penicillium verhagenii]KAJ5948122.1 hypothetical protein N7466_001137 [Penicillium verhagenii]